MLLPIHQDEIKRVQVSPIHDKLLDLKDLYVPLRIQKYYRAGSGNINDSEDEEQVKCLRDIFYSSETIHEKIFITGESGCGKTMLCLKLLESWVKSDGSHTLPDGSLEKCLATFDLVFYVPLRDFKDSSTSLVEMICNFISKGDLDKIRNIEHVLRSSQIRCLVIVDDLDEWKRTNTSLNDLDTYGLVNCVLLTTMRSWALSNIQMKFQDNDAIYEVLGIDPDYVWDMVGKVLVHFCGLEKTSIVYHSRLEQCFTWLQTSHFYSIINPMMLFVFVLRQNEEDEASKGDLNHSKQRRNLSNTQLLLSMIEVMIQRAESKDNLVKSYIKQTTQAKHKSFEKIPGYLYINIFGNLLIPFCKLAYEDMIEGQDCLVFQKLKFQEKFGEDKSRYRS